MPGCGELIKTLFHHIQQNTQQQHCVADSNLGLNGNVKRTVAGDTALTHPLSKAIRAKKRKDQTATPIAGFEFRGK